ncbi:MAG: hypothetical protein FJX65_02245 [Alphaproteobacteria bacterium]|nr:hypothetical protein [Alphaproteobacteria bacterium]
MSERDDDSEVDPDDPQIQRLTIVARFSRHVLSLEWGRRLGKPLSKDERADAQAYLDAAGFPDASIAVVTDWHEAAHIAENPNWNDGWWEAEQQLQSGLVSQAVAVIDQNELIDALNHVASQTAGAAVEAIETAAQRADYREDKALGEEGSFLTALSGFAVASSYQAGLVLAAGADEHHPFSIKFRLVESGRLPIGVIGNTFTVF